MKNDRKLEFTATMIDYPSGGKMSQGYLSQPTQPGNYIGVIVIQEWWGLVAHIKDVADRFAQQGYVALAPDLYDGKTSEEPNEAQKLALALDRERAIAEIAAAARYLNGLEAVGRKKVGVVGWCMGGGLSLSAAAHNGDIGAAVVYYGRPLDARDTAKIHVPILGLYGELDTGIPVSIVKDFERELEENNIEHDIHVYAGAQHAFFNDTRSQVYDADSAVDAWTRTLAWFEKHLM